MFEWWDALNQWWIDLWESEVPLWVNGMEGMILWMRVKWDEKKK